MLSLSQRYHSSVGLRILLQKIAIGLMITAVLVVLLTDMDHDTDFARDITALLICLAVQIALGQWLLWRNVLRPIGAIKAAMHKRAIGDVLAHAPMMRPDEIGALAQTLNDMLDAVNASEARLRAVLATAIDGIITLDANGTIQDFTLAAEKIFGYGAGEVIGSNLNKLIPETGSDPRDDLLAEYIRTGNDKAVGICRVVTARRKNGEQFPMEFAINQAISGNSSIFVGIVRDVTDRQVQEQQIFSYAQLLEGKTLELEHATQMKSEFLANMSHEIRTPMNGIIGMSELLMQSPLTVKQRHYAETVLHSAESLLTLINDILDLSKVESGKMELEPVIFDMQKMTHEIVNLFTIKSEEKGIILAMTYAPEAPRYVVGDQTRIRQIFSNLISNAIKFTKKGQVLLAIEANLEREEDAGMASIRVKVIDTGIGIKPEVQKLIFEKFTQADASTTRKYGGTGLGLAICRELVGMMNGEIGVTSQLDVGSTFWFTLSLRRAEAPLITESESNKETQELVAGDMQFQNVYILLAEDNHIDQEYEMEMLRGLGCRVALAENGEAALSRTAEEKFDLILMDCEMPQITGYRAAHILTARKNEGGYPDIPIIALAASDEPEIRERCLLAGMADVLTKPVRKEALVQIMIARLPKDRVVNAAQKTAQNHLIGKHVLLVEDSAVNQMFLKETLQQIGCHVTIAENGLEAIAAVQAESDLNLILMDGHMPVMDGFEATRSIRDLQKAGAVLPIPIIALTAMAMHGDRERCLEAGMDDYLPKPVRKDALVAMLLKWQDKEGTVVKPDKPPEVVNATGMLVDNAVKEEMRKMLGDKYNRFLTTYLNDTENRLQDISNIIKTKGDARKIMLHAHSISSSSAYAGAMRVADLAGTLEQTAGQKNNDFTTIAKLHSVMRQSFDETRQMLEAG